MLRFIGELKLLLIKPTFAGAREIGFHGGWRDPSRIFWVSSPAQRESELSASLALCREGQRGQIHGVGRRPQIPGLPLLASC